MMVNRKKKATIAVLVALVLILASTGIGLFLRYYYKKGTTKIDNFSEYYYNVPNETQRIISAILYSTIEDNISNEVPSEGALIRNSEPYLYNYNDAYNGLSGRFIVDIPKIQQSYLIEFNYMEDPDAFNGGYAALAYCLDEDEMIYPDFGCKTNLPFYVDNITGETKSDE